PGEIAIGRGDDAEIGPPYRQRSKRPKFFLLEHPWQFRLQVERQLADFVEKRVPPLAASISPVLLCAAPVKAPLTWRNSSLSTRGPTGAGQSMVMKGPWGLCA